LNHTRRLQATGKLDSTAVQGPHPGGAHANALAPSSATAGILATSLWPAAMTRISAAAARAEATLAFRAALDAASVMAAVAAVAAASCTLTTSAMHSPAA
jgi:hypothetical protein